MTCHDTKDNAGLYRFRYVNFSKTITIILVSFLLLYIVFYWNILRYVLVLQTQQ